MLVYDFEVFCQNWLCVIADYKTKKFITIVDDREKFMDYFVNHKDELWVGFNNKNYDQYIVKALLLGINPYKVSQHIIKKRMPGFTYSSDFNKVYVKTYDVFTNLTHGLKFYEGCMGDSIEESSVPFDIERALTKAEIEEVAKYCRHDVEETMKIFFKCKNEFTAQVGLSSLSNAPNSMCKTHAQLAGVILGAKQSLWEQENDEFNIDIPPTLELNKYAFIKDWYLDARNMHYDKYYEVDVAGVKHHFGFGGLHGAREKYHTRGNILLMDVASLYPSLMIEYDLLSRAVKDKSTYVKIREQRLEYKKNGNSLHLPLKLVLNSTYGAMKDKNNPLYDPRQANRVCVYGQLLILDLIEHLEPYCEILQTNTDSTFISYRNENLNQVMKIINDWQTRTRLKLEIDNATEIWQKDVNNYIIKLADGTYKRKGAYVKKLSELDYGDYPIINKALFENLTNGTAIATTINNCNDLIDFQMVCKITGKFEAIYYGNKRLNEKTVRVFASKGNLPSITKMHSESGSFYKIANAPEHLFIDNTDIHGKPVPQELDREFYINFAKKRLSEFV